MLSLNVILNGKPKYICRVFILASGKNLMYAKTDVEWRVRYFIKKKKKEREILT